MILGRKLDDIVPQGKLKPPNTKTTNTPPNNKRKPQTTPPIYPTPRTTKVLRGGYTFLFFLYKKNNKRKGLSLREVKGKAGTTFYLSMF